MPNDQRTTGVVRRALVALALLVGFYVLGLAIAAGLLWTAWLMVTGRLGGARSGRLAIACLFGAVAILWSLVPRLDRFHVRAPRLDRDAQPRLFEAIDRIAVAAGEHPPVEVYLLPEVNAFVSQRGGFMGLGGRRVMGIGLPLLAALTPRQAEAVIAHEFGHFSAQDTRLAPLVYQARAAIERTMATLDGSVLNVLFRWYGTMFLRLSQRVSRRQEFAADELAARLTDPATAMAALRRVEIGSFQFERFVRADVDPALRGGCRPPIAAGLRRFATAPENRTGGDAYLADVLANAPDEPYASHPTLRERVAALEALAALKRPSASDRGDVADGESAVAWLDDIDGLEAELVDPAADRGDRPPLTTISWDDVGETRILPRFVVAAQFLGDHIQGVRLPDLPPTGAERRAFAAAWAGRRGIELSDEDVTEIVASSMTELVCIALADRGWRLDATPERPRLLMVAPGADPDSEGASGAAGFEPVGAIHARLDGTLDDAAWGELCMSLGIADSDLQEAVARQRERFIREGVLAPSPTTSANPMEAASDERDDVKDQADGVTADRAPARLSPTAMTWLKWTRVLGVGGFAIILAGWIALIYSLTMEVLQSLGMTHTLYGFPLGAWIAVLTITPALALWNARLLWRRAPGSGAVMMWTAPVIALLPLTVAGSRQPMPNTFGLWLAATLVGGGSMGLVGIARFMVEPVPPDGGLARLALLGRYGAVRAVRALGRRPGWRYACYSEPTSLHTPTHESSGPVGDRLAVIKSRFVLFSRGPRGKSRTHGYGSASSVLSVFVATRSRRLNIATHGDAPSFKGLPEGSYRKAKDAPFRPWLWDFEGRPIDPARWNAIVAQLQRAPRPFGALFTTEHGLAHVSASAFRTGADEASLSALLDWLAGLAALLEDSATERNVEAAPIGDEPSTAL